MKQRRRSGITPGSLLAEASAGVTGRPARSTLTSLGIAIGLTALVTSIGISQSAGAQIVTRFHDSQASHLTAGGPSNQPLLLEPDIAQTVQHRPGVTNVAWVAQHGDSAIARARAPEDTQAAVTLTLSVLGSDTNMFTTTSAGFAAGRAFDKGHVQRHAPIAVIGIGAARRLGISTIAGQPAVFVDGHQLLIIGILESTTFFAQTLDSIIVPYTTAADLYGKPSNTSVLVTTKRGSTYTVAQDLPYLLHPQRPEEIDIAIPPPPPDVADAVSSDLDTLALTLAGVGAIVAAISVTAIMTINVVERIPEIGLRRAFGASRRAIAAQFLLESATIGIIGGLSGATLGLALLHGAARLREWTPVMDATVPYLALILGAAIGLLAGTYPATRAARIPPTTSLRA